MNTDVFKRLFRTPDLYARYGQILERDYSYDKWFEKQSGYLFITNFRRDRLARYMDMSDRVGGDFLIIEAAFDANGRQLMGHMALYGKSEEDRIKCFAFFGL